MLFFNSKKTKVNAELAVKWQEDGKQTDDRFKDIFENPEMAIDKDSERYKILKPVGMG